MKNILPDLRSQRGWTQGELAVRLSVSRQTVNAVETGRYEPSLSLAFAIGALFELPIENIFQGHHQMRRFAPASDGG
jgi:putative transcriptional regulator